MLQFSFSLIVEHACSLNNKLITAEEYDNVRTTSLQYVIRPKLFHANERTDRNDIAYSCFSYFCERA
jgi:hypothetical protein